MNYKEVKKSYHTRSLPSINAAAEIELGRKLTKEEVNTLSNKFSLDVVHASVEKVCFHQVIVIKII